MKKYTLFSIVWTLVLVGWFSTAGAAQYEILQGETFDVPETGGTFVENELELLGEVLNETDGKFFWQKTTSAQVGSASLSGDLILRDESSHNPKVGIGTGSPIARLHVTGENENLGTMALYARSVGNFQVHNNGHVSINNDNINGLADVRLYVGGSLGAGFDSLYVDDGSNNRIFHLTENGLLGLGGETNPENTLHILDDVSPGAEDYQIFLQDNNTAGGNTGYKIRGGEDFRIANEAETVQFFMDGNFDDSNQPHEKIGYVGIGTTQPQQQLHVNGTVRIDIDATEYDTFLCIDGDGDLAECPDPESAGFTGSIQYNNGLGGITGDDQIVWNDTDKSLGIRTMTPSSPNALEVKDFLYDEGTGQCPGGYTEGDFDGDGDAADCQKESVNTVINEDGYFGIGTDAVGTIPMTIFDDVNDGTDRSIRLRDNNGGGVNTGWDIQGGKDLSIVMQGSSLGADDNRSFYMQNGIPAGTASGFIGLNVSPNEPPLARLDVNGKVRVRDLTSVDGTSQIVTVGEIGTDDGFLAKGNTYICVEHKVACAIHCPDCELGNVGMTAEPADGYVPPPSAGFQETFDTTCPGPPINDQVFKFVDKVSILHGHASLFSGDTRCSGPY